MKRSTLVRIAVIVAAAAALLALGPVADGWMVAQGGDPISGNVTMIVLVVAAALVVGVVAKDRNRVVGTAGAEARAEALGFAPKAGLGQVVVFRNDRMGAQIGADIGVDGSLFTQLTSPGFTLVDLAPGRHRIAVAFQARQAEQEVEVKAGEVIALHVKMRMGLTESIPTLEAVAPEEARRLIGKAPMALPVTGGA